MSADAILVVRPGHDADLAACAAILADGYRSFIQSDSWPPELAQALVSSQCTRSHLRSVAGRELLTVAVSTAVVAGFISILGHEVTHLFIASSRRRQGIGHRLITHAKEAARAAGHGQLSVFCAARSAAAFYRRVGFSIVGEITIADGPCAGRSAVRLEYALR